MKKIVRNLGKETELDHLRSLFAQTDQPRPPKGVRKFFRELAERSARPSKNVIMTRIREAS